MMFHRCFELKNSLKINFYVEKEKALFFLSTIVAKFWTIINDVSFILLSKNKASKTLEKDKIKAHLSGLELASARTLFLWTTCYA